MMPCRSVIRKEDFDNPLIQERILTSYLQKKCLPLQTPFSLRSRNNRPQLSNGVPNCISLVPGMVKRAGCLLAAIDETLGKLGSIPKDMENAKVAEKNTITQKSNEELLDSVRMKMVLSLLFILLLVRR